MTFSFLRTRNNIGANFAPKSEPKAPLALNIPAETETRRRRFDQARDVGSLYRAANAAGAAIAMETAD